MKMIDIVKNAIELSQENLTQEINNLTYKLKHGRYMAKYQREKDKNRLERLNRRIEENNIVMKDVARKNFEFFNATYNVIQKSEYNLKTILECVKRHEETLTEEQAYTILMTLNTELKKRRSIKIHYLLSYAWNLSSLNFYTIYYTKTKKFKDLFESLNIKNTCQLFKVMSFKKVDEEISDLFSYSQDLKHYIELAPLSLLRIESVLILKEFANAYLESTQRYFDNSFIYKDVLEECFKEGVACDEV